MLSCPHPALPSLISPKSPRDCHFSQWWQRYNSHPIPSPPCHDSAWSTWHWNATQASWPPPRHCVPLTTDPFSSYCILLKLPSPPTRWPSNAPCPVLQEAQRAQSRACGFYQGILWWGAQLWLVNWWNVSVCLQERSISGWDKEVKNLGWVPSRHHDSNKTPPRRCRNGAQDKAFLSVLQDATTGPQKSISSHSIFLLHNIINKSSYCKYVSLKRLIAGNWPRHGGAACMRFQSHISVLVLP